MIAARGQNGTVAIAASIRPIPSMVKASPTRAGVTTMALLTFLPQKDPMHFEIQFLFSPSLATDEDSELEEDPETDVELEADPKGADDDKLTVIFNSLIEIFFHFSMIELKIAIIFNLKNRLKLFLLIF